MSFKIQNVPAIKNEAGPHTFEAVQQLEKVVNDISKQMDWDPAGQNIPPQPIAALNVTAANGIANVQIVDNFPTLTDPSHTRTINYTVEFATDPGFKNVVHHEDMGPARNKNIFLGNQTLHVRAYSQTSGSPPSTPTLAAGNPHTFGGVAAPTQQTYQGSGTSTVSGQGSGVAVGNKVTPVFTS